MTRRTQLSRGARLLGGYLGIPLLNAVSPLLALPAIAHTAGAEGWAAIAIGQSLGGAAGVLVELGWGSPAPSASPARPAATSPRPTRPD